MRRFLTALAFSILSALPGSAQTRDTAATILVLDASGSMWGQIDGVNKIVIAREVIGNLLTQIPEDMALGLTMYGHNRRGDCSDIETMVEPGIGNRDEIARIVNSVNPRGRTPLSDAVIQAAQALRYTENPATVILVSDGRETCDADPCAVGRALEEAGIDFTAHVIGFDVSDPEDRAQLQCLAENTGGQFLTAANADELAAALEQVVAAPPPPPAMITLQAVVSPNNTAPISPLIWEVFDADNQVVLTETQAPTVSQTLPAGTYRIELYRLAQETTHGGAFTVIAGQDQVVTLVLPAIIPTATLDAPDETPIGSEIAVDWTGPNDGGDAILVIRADGSVAASRVHTRDGNPAMITMPTQTGSYILQYYHQDLQLVLAEEPIIVTPIPASIEAPETAVAGSTIQVIWSGPGGTGDFIAAGQPDERAYDTHALTRNGNPVDLRVPSIPGSYELRYVMGQGREVLARRMLTVTPVLATLDGPETAIAGSDIQVIWTGPDYQNDFISVSELDDDRGYENFTFTREGTPLTLTMPVTPGTYELRYYVNPDRTIIGRRVIEVTELLASVAAPDTAIAGSTIQISWTGPDYQSDFISISEVSAARGYENFTYTREGSPLDLLMPTEPGDYEIRYVLNQDREVIARRTITVTDVGASIDGPASAIAGAPVQITWTGPDYQNDFIAISAVDDASGYENYTYTREGNPLVLDMPTEPGDYEIRYYVNQDRQIIARRNIEVTALDVTMQAQSTALVGETLQITWIGPDYQNDFIAISRSNDATGYEAYTYSREGSPLMLQMPNQPGNYELRYYVSQDRQIVARLPITISDLPAIQLDGPSSGIAGGTIQVRHTGPDYHGDFIGFGEVGNDRRYNGYEYTRNGNPLTMDVPDEPGEYELRYYMQPDNRIIARRMITITGG